MQKGGGTPDDFLFLAIQRLGHTAEARRWLNRSVRWVRAHEAEQPWAYRVELRFLLAEAKALVGRGGCRRGAQRRHPSSYAARPSTRFGSLHPVSRMAHRASLIPYHAPARLPERVLRDFPGRFLREF